MKKPAPDRDAQRAALEKVEDVEAERARLFQRAMARRADVAELWRSEPSGFVEMELAGTALIGQVRAASELETAVRLREVMVQTDRLLADGVLFVPQAELLLRETRRCDERVQALVDARVAAKLVGRNVTDCRRLISRTILSVEAEIDPALTQQRLDAAKSNTRVWVSPSTDGTTSIGAVLDCVVGRRWAVDFEALVGAQRTLDKRDGVERGVEEVRAAVFGSLPSLVLELCRAARNGDLQALTELAEVDAESAVELQQLALSTADLPLPETETEDETEDEADVDVDADVEVVEDAAAAIVVEEDPFDEALCVADPFSDVSWAATEPAAADDEPVDDPHAHTSWDVPPDVVAAQDAARGTAGHTTEDAHRQELHDLLLRCLRMPLPDLTVLNLHIPMTTLLDLDETAGVLEGYGPVPARRVRYLVPISRLRRVYVDEETGVPIGIAPVTPTSPATARVEDNRRRVMAELEAAFHVGITDSSEPQHDPSRRLAELVKTRDQKCSGPGCSMPASRCHLDHETPFPEGPTAEWNLGDKSPRCHQAKHHGWSVARLADGSTTWTSPTERTYATPSPWDPPPTSGA